MGDETAVVYAPRGSGLPRVDETAEVHEPRESAQPKVHETAQAHAPVVSYALGTAEAALAGPPEGSAEADEGAGGFVEIYSNSCQRWCAGVVQAEDASSVLVAYQTPGDSPLAPNMNIKTLPADSAELRPPQENGAFVGCVVEVYNHSHNLWCCGVIQKIEGRTASVMIDLNVASNGEPTIKVLPLGHQDMILFGAAGAAEAIAGGGTSHIDVGSKVEIYSNSMQVWCAGLVQQIVDGVATVCFYYPDMDPNKEAPCVKEVPVGHHDLRLLAEVQAVDFAVGRPVDVFSRSRQLWLPGHITGITGADGDIVQVAFRYPDVSDTELYTKELPMDSPELRFASE